MNPDINQHETYIAAPDDKSKMLCEAIPPAADPKVMIPGPTDENTGFPREGRTSLVVKEGTFFGMNLVWRGLRLMGWTFVGFSTWYYGYFWVEGRFPQYAPSMLAVLAGILLVASLVMVFCGAQDATPRINIKDILKTDRR